MRARPSVVHTNEVGLGFSLHRQAIRLFLLLEQRHASKVAPQCKINAIPDKKRGDGDWGKHEGVKGFNGPSKKQLHSPSDSLGSAAHSPNSIVDLGD